jgi:hypothetical protein
MCVFHIQLPAHEVRLSGDLSEIYIAEETFAAGDLVVVFSVLSQESIHGKILQCSTATENVRTCGFEC